MINLSSFSKTRLICIKNKLRASYSYDSKQGIIESCQAELIENLANNKMCSKQEFEVKFIKEEIKVWRNY
ncbi:hypothetical protein SAMN06265364_14123 [Prevotella jejuni]|uniref:Uncharacterized protein n=1 Tax=Prevotella jejuni TaxID=1177574 RepID=A0AA94LLU6_9BACT|nr:hypothetical protein SAMN06265364_14123 [Prevotella jejuni]